MSDLTAILMFLADILPLVLLVYVGHQVDLLRRQLDQIQNDTKRTVLRLHTRVKQASVQTGPTTEDQTLKKLSRASRGRRVVVGGDPDSELFARLDTTPRENDDE